MINMFSKTTSKLFWQHILNKLKLYMLQIYLNGTFYTVKQKMFTFQHYVNNITFHLRIYFLLETPHTYINTMLYVSHIWSLLFIVI